MDLFSVQVNTCTSFDLAVVNECDTYKIKLCVCVSVCLCANGAKAVLAARARRVSTACRMLHVECAVRAECFWEQTSHESRTEPGGLRRT